MKKMTFLTFLASGEKRYLKKGIWEKKVVHFLFASGKRGFSYGKKIIHFFNNEHSVFHMLTNPKKIRNIKRR